VPVLEKVWSSPSPIYLNGKKMFILSLNNYATIDVAGKFSKYSEAVKRDFSVHMEVDNKLAKLLKLKYDYPSHIIDFSIKDTPASINVTALDCELDSDMSSQSFRILQTKAISMLQEPSSRRLLTSMIISGLLGLCMGLVGGILGIGLILYLHH
jgi:hypothetical protein